MQHLPWLPSFRGNTANNIRLYQPRIQAFPCFQRFMQKTWEGLGTRLCLYQEYTCHKSIKSYNIIMISPTTLERWCFYCTKMIAVKIHVQYSLKISRLKIFTDQSMATKFFSLGHERFSSSIDGRCDQSSLLNCKEIYPFIWSKCKLCYSIILCRLQFYQPPNELHM